mmetsp:Transcript_21490/g.26367  ORF Transcript_21490/g.26367 Transcript_21490/m.26367 type:complete len:559 (-) Transcript_21490:2385-4061(-)
MEAVSGLRHDTLIKVPIESDGLTTTVVYNLSANVNLACFDSTMLQLSMLILILLSLGCLRSDANQLVMMPLRRMLKIVLRYARNPLAAATKSNNGKNGCSNEADYGTLESDLDLSGKDKLGSYETEQLITAVTKITDLLRKCWGVAGAGIISTNLARNMNGDTVVFNPTVPGKQVYALFGFAAINDFSYLLRSLDTDVMNLINDVAKVIHNEVYRWGLGDSGQCNKNLGAAFLMVYRIGDFKEVQEKNKKAKNVIFGSIRSNSSMIQDGNELNNINLASLPGISAFADRAVLGMLKTFAGINREKSVKDWEKNIKLGAFVGAFSVEMSFGMDAGWAVEGAVGSSYKIDATYLSPHVNMASRMMSACKQYGLTILLSQAVEELLSQPCRKQLRHIDTVFVKGAATKQRIYTFDARHKGIDFFLNKRTDKQADKDADNYSPSLWLKDLDLQEMRSHVTPEFVATYEKGLNQYLIGNWSEAVIKLKEANEIMIRTVVDSGRLENINLMRRKIIDRNSADRDVIHMREEFGDGPSRTIVAYIEKEGGAAPEDWKGVRQLTSK